LLSLFIAQSYLKKRDFHTGSSRFIYCPIKGESTGKTVSLYPLSTSVINLRDETMKQDKLIFDIIEREHERQLKGFEFDRVGKLRERPSEACHWGRY